MIRDVIEHYTGSFSGSKVCCPLHGEKTPSLHVYEDTNSWYCHGACAHGGDTIEFVKKVESVGFKEYSGDVEGLVEQEIWEIIDKGEE